MTKSISFMDSPWALSRYIAFKRCTHVGVTVFAQRQYGKIVKKIFSKINEIMCT